MVTSLYDSLVIGDMFELLGGPDGVPSAIPLLAGAVYHLQPGYDLGMPQPTTDITASLALDGERPFGYRASNRTITLPIIIKAPDFQTLTAAREELFKVVNQQTWSLTWTRATSGQFSGAIQTTLPLIFDCYRAQPSTIAWGGVDQYNFTPVGLVTLTFQATPYARSEIPVTVDFPQPLAGREAPPSPVFLDTYASVSGTQWAANTQSPVPGTASAFFDPGATPAAQPSGQGVIAKYSVTGLSVDISQGWTGMSQNNSAFLNQFTALVQDVAGMSVGDYFQFAANWLTGDSAGFEGGTAGNWTAQTNCSISNTTAQAHSGTHSLALSSTAAGNMTAISGNAASIPGTMSPVLPNDIVYASAWLRAATAARGTQVGVQFFGPGPNFTNLGTAFGVGGAQTDSTSAWTQVTTVLGASAPAGAAWACVVVQVNSTGGAAEVHYVDDAYIATRESALVQNQIFQVVSIGPIAAGFQNVGYTPNSLAAPVTGEVAIQVSPPELNSITFWAGFGSTSFYHHWSRLGGRVSFAFTLTDVYGTVLSFSKTVKVTGSNNSAVPRWNRIRIPIPSVSPSNPSTVFDFHNVTGYTLTVTNRGLGDLRYTQLYLSQLQVAPAPVVPAPVTPQRGALYELTGIVGSARAPVSIQLQQTGTQNTGQFFTRPGTSFWTAPASVTTLSGVAIGGGGSGGIGGGGVGGGGGGGGGSAQNGSIGVTPGHAYQVVVGKGGIYQNFGGGVSFTPATASSFTGDSVTITGPAGGSGTSSTTAAGTGGTAGAGGFAGGTGGAGTSSGTGGGGGGGGSAGTAANGNNGGAASGSTGGTGAAAVTFGGPGGRGGTFGHGNGITPQSFGGGGGGSPAFASGYFFGGANGMVSLNYNTPKMFQSLVLHRPPPAGSESMSPVLPVSIGDPADGSVTYTFPSVLANQVNARPQGTYSVFVVANSWTTPSSSRTITVTITQFEQQGGASYTATVAATVTPSTFPTLSDTNASNAPIVLLGEITLPIQDIPQDNLNSYFTASITDTITTDTFSDILFLDTMGSTVVIQSPTAYSNMYVDEPNNDRDLGLVLGSLFDRADATSILDRALVTGGPVNVDPEGNALLLVYAVEGSPQVQMKYFPRWWTDRVQ